MNTFVAHSAQFIQGLNWYRFKAVVVLLEYIVYNVFFRLGYALVAKNLALQDGAK